MQFTQMEKSFSLHLLTSHVQNLYDTVVYFHMILLNAAFEFIKLLLLTS